MTPRAFDLASAALAAVLTEFITAEVAAPSVAYVSTGDVAFDCEQLTVAAVRMYGLSPEVGFPADASGSPLRCLHWQAVQLQVVSLRCAPVPRIVRDQAQPIPPAEFEKSAQEVLTDAEVITRGLVKAYRADAFGVGPIFALQDWAALTPDGGLVGGRLNVTIGLV